MSVKPIKTRATMQVLYDEARLKLEFANEILSSAHLFPGQFNSTEIRRATQESAEAVSILAELDILVNDDNPEQVSRVIFFRRKPR